MDATPQPPAARSSVLRSATLASVTLLLDAKNLCKLVGCSEEPGLEPTAAEDSPGRESGLAENNHPGEPPEDSNGEGHSGAEGSASDPAVIPGEGKDGLSAAGGRKEEQGDGSGQLATGVNGASGEERVDSWRLTASCQGGAALAVRLVERLLVEAVAPEWRGAQEGPPAPDGSDGIQSRTACGPVVSDDGQIWTVKTPDGSGRSGVPVLSRGQFIELLCVHCVLTSFLRRAESESRKKAEIEEMGRSSSKSSSSSDIGFGLPSLLGVLDCIERSCHTPSSARLAQLTPSAQLAVLHALSLARGFVEKDLSGSARASEVQGPTLRDLSGLVRRAVGLFKNSCLSALELAEIHAPTAELELEPLEDGGLLQSMPAALALARALETDSADLAAVAGGRSEEGPTEARLEEAEGAPRTREALDRWGGVKGVGFGRSSLQLAALTTLSVAFEWLERHSLSSKSQVESKKRRGDGEREDGRGSQSGTQRDALASEKQGPRSTAELDALVAGCVSPDEGAAVFLVARELVGEDSVMEELGLEGPPNPLGQLLVYVAVILRLEMEAGLEVNLVPCRVLPPSFHVLGVPFTLV